MPKPFTLKFVHSVICKCLNQFLFPKQWQNILYFTLALQQYTTKTFIQAKSSGMMEVCGILFRVPTKSQQKVRGPVMSPPEFF